MIHKEFTKVPKGFSIDEGATTAPKGKVWLTNHKSFFGGERVSGLIDEEKWNKYKETAIARDINNVKKKRS